MLIKKKEGVVALSKIWKAGKYKVVPDNHPDMHRARKICIKREYKDERRREIRAKQYWSRIPIVFKTEYSKFNEDACLACSCKKTVYCKNCRFNDKSSFTEDLSFEW